MRINLYQPYYYYVFKKLTVALSNNARSSYKNDDMSTRKRWSFADVSWLNVITGYERDCWILSTFLNSTDVPVEYKRLGSGNHSVSIHNTQYNIRLGRIMVIIAVHCLIELSSAFVHDAIHVLTIVC